MSKKFPGGIITAGADTGYSVAFDGTGDYLTVPNNAVFNFGSSDFTLEAWVYVISKPSTYSWFIHHGDSATAGGSAWSIGLENNTLNLSLYSGSTGTGVNSTITTWNYNTWVHVAATRSGNTIRLFANGALVKTDTYSSTLNSPTSVINIGSGAGGDSRCNAYISNARVVNGTAVYTTAFTPPTQLFPVSGTSLLACQSPTLIDKSNNNFTITANGDAKVSNFTPFAGYKGFDPKLGAAAPGVWTLDEASYYQSNRQWPIYDPYFNQTTLLLHGNGTNTANNQSFIDSSSNNFAITRNGNATQGTFSPFSQTGWSNYLNSNNDEGLSYPTAANTVVGCPAGTKLTYEFWIYCSGILNETGYYMALAGASPSIGVNGRWAINFIGSSTTSDQYLYYYWTTGTGSADTAESTVPLKQNRWNHVAICIDATTASSSTIVIYQNGIGQTFTNKNLSTQTTANDPGYQQYIGGRRDDGSQTWNGYVKDFRVVRGSLVYTSNFTPPTAPLTAIPGTVLLTCQDNRFVDNSPYNWTMGAVSGTGTTGKPSTQAFSPFVPAYITPMTYSNKFDGTGDFISTSDASTACAFPGGTDFTIECWFNNVATVSDGTIWSTSSSIGSSEQLRLDGGANNNTLRVISTYTTKITASATYSNATWNHIAVVRSGTTLTLYQNGINIGSVSNNQSFTADSFTIGSCGGAGGPFPFNGLVSNLRVVKGTALYTTNFTPPSAPLVAIPGTQLLTCQDSTFRDNSINNFTITASGDAKPVSSPTPFPPKVDTTTLNSAYSTSLIGGSAYFDGTGDYLRTPTDVAFALGTSDFTFETWLYPTVAGNDSVIIDNRNPSGGTNGFAVSWATSNYVRVIVGAPNTWDVDQSTAAVGTNSWTHYALTRSGTTFRIFLNGALVYTSGSISGSLGTTAVYATVGAAYNGANPFTGYFSGTRLIKGTALYTSSFAPPVAPPTPVTNTSVLLNYTNAGIIDNAAKNVLETVDNAQISTTQSKWGGSSMYFDGTGDNLTIPSNNLYNLGSSDFTIEFWFYPPSISYGAILYSTNNGSKTDVFAIYSYGSAQSPANSIAALVTASGGGAWSLFNNQLIGATTAATWQHVALVRNGSTFKGYMNGVAGFTVTSSSAIASFNGFSIGSNGASGDYLTGYIDDLRITRVARYITNFTPPTSQLQDQ